MPYANAGFTRRLFLKQATAAAAATALTNRQAFAQARGETLLVVQELGPNSRDMQGVGSNQTVNGLSWNCYDRLMNYASKTLPDSTPTYNRMTITPELAER
jgi:peptide/nickel transport system substrate-binding protein